MTEENEPLEKPSEAGIQQLNLSYDKVQDRLLFRVGLSDDTELALWFTYRFARQLWAALNAEAHLPEAHSQEAKRTQPEAIAETVEQFKQEVDATEALQEMDFETEYEPRQALRNDGMLLATSLVFSDDAKHLDITCLEGVVANLNLTHELLLAMCNMLQLAAKEAGWELTTASPSIMVEALSVSKVLH
ncbi:MAG: hypothetical protein V3U89_02755 [Methylophilaceae bacterium]